MDTWTEGADDRKPMVAEVSVVPLQHEGCQQSLSATIKGQEAGGVSPDSEREHHRECGVAQASTSALPEL